MAQALVAQDHPRGCGEQLTAEHTVIDVAGSSPRVRGTAARPAGNFRRWRIIPAGAGNRATEALSASTPADHPRGCGEQRDAHDLRVFEPGSSPRVRGTGRGVGYRAGAARIIPAGAGNSATSALREESDPDHPRGCGEQSAMQGQT